MIKRIVFALILPSLLMVSLSGCGSIVKLISQKDKPSEPEKPNTQDSNSASKSDQPESAQSKSDNLAKSNQSESTQSKSQTPARPPATKAEVLSQLNCRKASESDYIYGNYRVGWMARGDRYEGLLAMKGAQGVMRVQYYNPSTKAADVVDQTMIVASCPRGLLIAGVDPVVPQTDKKHPTYVADNILLRRNPSGQVIVELVDDQGVASPAEIEKVKNN